MRSTFSGFNTVVSGLAAQQLALDTTGQNISNGSTPGYSRQRVNLTSANPQQIYIGSGQAAVGNGVTVQSITRARDFLVDSQYWQQSSSSSYWQTQSDSMSKIENIFYDTDKEGIQATINKFSKALDTLANSAGDTAAMTNVRETGNSLVQILKQDGQALATLGSNLSAGIKAGIDDINNISTQIAALNKQITTQEVGGAKANDLRDKRDLLIDQLSVLAKVNVSEDSTGGYTVLLSGSVPLVQGQYATQLEVNTTHDSLYNFDTNSITVANGTIPVKMPTGSISSMIQMRDVTVKDNLDKLDNMAKFLMQDFNAQQKAGFDANGNAGKNFFGDTAKDYATAADDPTLGVPPQSWLSQLAVNATLYAQGGEKLVAMRDTATSTANGQNATKMAAVLQVASTAATPNALHNASLSDYYGTIISALGVQSQQAGNMAKNQQIIVNATSTVRQSISGVSTDEEMSNMIKFQQIYGACAKVMTTLNDMMNTLINGTGVGR